MIITIIGCKDAQLLKHYPTDQEMHETCDVVIEMIDCCFWEVFSKDEKLIQQLAVKFKDTKFLDPDFQNKPLR